jgi:hypothetical protein
MGPASSLSRAFTWHAARSIGYVACAADMAEPSLYRLLVAPKRQCREPGADDHKTQKCRQPGRDQTPIRASGSKPVVGSSRNSTVACASDPRLRLACASCRRSRFLPPGSRRRSGPCAPASRRPWL